MKKKKYKKIVQNLNKTNRDLRNDINDFMSDNPLTVATVTMKYKMLDDIEKQIWSGTTCNEKGFNGLFYFDDEPKVI